ncbi:Apoptosis-inducing factor 3 [Manis javanica]|nr:Apoptosis-inducing factor 3 [Manis javanica]
MNIVVIGHGMVGHKFLRAAACPGRGRRERHRAVREPRAPPTTVFTCRNSSPAKRRGPEPGGARLLRGQRLHAAPGGGAAAVERRRRTVTTADGEIIPYDRLVLATGSAPFVPPVPGRDHPHCFVYRTIEDLEAMQASAARSRTGVVVGGGLLGLECARPCATSRRPGDPCGRVRPAPDGRAGGRRRRPRAAQQDRGPGRAGAHGPQYAGDHRRRHGARHRMVFADGTHLETDMIVFSAGIRPRDEIARQCALALRPARRRGRGRPLPHNDRSVYAIGECASWRGEPSAWWHPALTWRAWRPATLQASRGRLRREPISAPSSSSWAWMWPASATPQGKTPRSRNCQFIDERKQVYKKIVVSEDGRQLLGAVLVGNADEYGTLLQMLWAASPCEEPEFLILPSSDSKAKPGLSVDALPDPGADLLVQQRHQGADLRGRGQAPAPWPSSSPAPRPAPPAAAACRWPPRS